MTRDSRLPRRAIAFLLAAGLGIGIAAALRPGALFVVRPPPLPPPPADRFRVPARRLPPAGILYAVRQEAGEPVGDESRPARSALRAPPSSGSTGHEQAGPARRSKA